MDKIKRNSIIFNALSGTINSLQSVIWLMIVTRVLGINEAGIFTISYAIATLFLLIGYFSVRDFQVSDLYECYSWREYYVAREISIMGMMIVAIFYCFYMYYAGGYTLYKSVVIFLMTLLKAIDAYEGVFHGMYQQRGRLDIAGISMSIRLGSQLIVFSFFLFLKCNLLISLIFTNVFSWILVILLQKKCNQYIGVLTKHFTWEKVMEIFKLCMVVCLSSFIGFYLCNLPKYRIDALMTETEQAYYGFISMPVFVVYLLSNFIYQPMLKDISELWTENKKRGFIRKILKIMMYISGASFVVLIGGYLFGIWSLELLYGVELDIYKREFIILLFGSAMYAFSTFYKVLLIVMRKQNSIFLTHIIILGISLAFTTKLIKTMGMMGAALSYTVTMAGLAIILFVILLYYIFRGVREKK